MSHQKVLPIHINRQAIVYPRQSTLKQLYDHPESTRRQYALKDRAVSLGWSDHLITIIDEDNGQSGASANWRTGFQRIAEDVAHGRVGGIFSLEVSRLARCSSDWHRLLELCSLADVVIADEQAIYNPRDYNDRLLLGLKGTMSEAELYWMKLRMEGGRLSKARRGDLFFCPPAGYEWGKEENRFRLDPSEEVQSTIKLIFERFRIDRSAYGVSRYLARMGIRIPTRNFKTKDVIWVDASAGQVLQMLHNPIYAGTYAFGRKEERMGLVNGELKKRKIRYLPQSEWKSVIFDHHPSYISWEDFLENERILFDNQRKNPNGVNHGASREGHALLQGLVLCGRCGHRMGVKYQGNARKSIYQCLDKHIAQNGVCFGVAGEAVDKVVEQQFFAAVTNENIDLALNVVHETESQILEVERQWKARKDRLNYEAKLAERRYKAIDPDNRVVARTLEREWEEKLRNLEAAEKEFNEKQKSEKLKLDDADRKKILEAAKDLRSVWNAKSTTFTDKKNLLRIVIRDISLSPIDIPERKTRIQILWQSGAKSEVFAIRKDRYSAQATPKSTIKMIEDLAKKDVTDSKIAESLNELRLVRNLGVSWDTAAVRRVRYSNGIPSSNKGSVKKPNVREDGLYSVIGVADKIGVTPGLVRNWVSTGLLPVASKEGKMKGNWFKLDDGLIQKLLDAKNRRLAPNKRLEINQKL